MPETIKWGDQVLTLRNDVARVGKIRMLIPSVVYGGFKAYLYVGDQILFTAYGATRQSTVNKAYTRCMRIFKALGEGLDYEVES